MQTSLETRDAVESEIRKAFRGVTLGRGLSIRKAQAIGDWDSASASNTCGEIVDDWSQVPLEELERDCVEHLDEEGFRYYIPALMLSVLNHYDPASLRVIGTLGGLYPKKDSWEYHMTAIRCSTLRRRERSHDFLRHSLS